MIDTKLICIDGVTGSGKSTTAQRLCFHLMRLGYDVNWYWEHDSAHPIYGLAEMTEMLQTGRMPSNWMRDTILGRWQSLTAGFASRGGITILESTLFQTTIGFQIGMMVPHAAIHDHLGDVERCIAQLQPVLIHFYQSDLTEALQRVCRQRRGDNYQADWITRFAQTPYGKQTGLRDFDGMLRFYETTREIADAAFARLSIHKLAIENSRRDWPACERRMTEFLGLPAMQRQFADVVERPSRFTGRYKDTSTNEEVTVASDQDGLYFVDAYQTRLFQKTDTTFYVEGNGLLLSFDGTKRGKAERMKFVGSSPRENWVFLRL